MNGILLNQGGANVVTSVNKKTGDVTLHELTDNIIVEDSTLAIYGNGGSLSLTNSQISLLLEEDDTDSDITVRKGEEIHKLSEKADIDLVYKHKGSVNNANELTNSIQIGEVYKVINDSTIFNKQFTGESIDGLYNMDTENGIYLKFETNVDPRTCVAENDILIIKVNSISQTVQINLKYYEVSENGFSIYLTPTDLGYQYLKDMFFPVAEGNEFYNQGECTFVAKKNITSIIGGSFIVWNGETWDVFGGNYFSKLAELEARIAALETGGE